MTQIVEFDGKLYELNNEAMTAPLVMLIDPYRPRLDFGLQYVSRMFDAFVRPSHHMIIRMEDTDRMERRDRLRKALHRLPKRLRKKMPGGMP